MYDFKRCKLCGQFSGSIKFKLKDLALYACATCDFHYTDRLDELVDDQSSSRLLSNTEQQYIENQLEQNTQQLSVNLNFVQQHSELPKMNCLDVGCGAGVFPSLLHQAGAKVQAIEPQPLFGQFSQQHFDFTPRRELANHPYWQQGFTEHFDIVTLWDSLEHVNFPAETISALSQLIKPQGLLFLDTPARESLPYCLSEWSYRLSRGRNPLMLNSFYSSKRFGHKQIFNQQQLWQLVEQHGFSVIARSTRHNSKRKHVIVCRKQPQA